MVTLAQVNFFMLTDTFNMCHPSYESMSDRETHFYRKGYFQYVLPIM